MSGPTIQASGIVRRFGRAPALRGVDLEVAPGERVTIFGPNGAGKSTLLRVVATLLEPTEGTLQLFGGSPQKASVRRKIGILGHGSFLYPDLTAEENLAFHARLFGVAVSAQAIEASLVDVGLEGWGRRPVRTFSRGMEQRVGLARAFLHEPELLLLDEPFSGLDPIGVAMLEGRLAREHAAGRTVLLTTHDFEAGVAGADRALILSAGRVKWQSSGSVPDATSMKALFREVIDGGSHVGDSR